MSDLPMSDGLGSPERQRELLKQLLLEKTQQPKQAAASCAQRRLWLVSRLEQPNPSYNIPCHVTLRGALDVDALERSFNEVVRRHATLRTTFRELDGEPVQVVAPGLVVPLPVIDLTQAQKNSMRASIKNLISEEAQGLFDLNAGPLVRTKLLKLSAQEHVLVLTMHHIISDGWSIGVLVSDLFKIYEAFRAGRGSPLPNLPIQYLDYSHRQSRWLQGEEFRSQLAYWTERLADLPTLALPTDRPRPLVKENKGASYSFTLDAKLSGELKRLCEREGVTLFMLLLAAFSTLLYRYSGQTDVVVGSPIANRNRADVEGLVGFFVNMLVMRTDLSGDQSFRQLLSRVSESALTAYAHQDVPFERLVEHLRPDRDPSRNPLFQVVLALQNEVMPSIEIEGLTVSQPVVPGCDVSELDVQVAMTRFDLELHFWEGSAGLRGTWTFDIQLFDPPTVERMAQHFLHLMESAVSNPDGRISELPMLFEAERREILQEWNQTGAAYPRDASIVELYEAQAERWPTALAVTYGEERLTYGELNARANRVGRYLRRRGVGPEVPVGVLMERSVAMVIAWLGVLKAGGAYVPLDPEYPKGRLAFMLEDTAAPVLLTAGALKERLPEYAGHVACLDEDWGEIGEESAEDLQVALPAESLAYVIYTSGSTGQPKGVSVPHRAVVRLVCGANYVQLERDDRMVQASNASFDAATFEVWGALLNGAPLVGAGREVTLNPRRYKAFLAEHGITVLFMTTALFNQVAREVPDAFGGVRAVLFGGENADVGSVRRVLKSGGRPGRLLNVYGPTESTTFASWYEVSAVTEEAVTVPIGRPISNTQLYVLDAHRKPVPIGVSGELYVGGDGLARGYWRRAELTAEKFVANPFHPDPQSRLYRTGDLVRWTGEGAIEFLGRVDNQVKLRGFRIELGEVEAGLREYAGVRDAVVLLREDEAGEKRLVAYVVPETAGGVSMGGLREHMRGRLPGYMVPSAFVELERLPLTPNGKVDRKALPGPEGERQVEAAYVMPRNELEERIAGIWRDVLGIEKLGIDDNFFDLGGDSIRLIRVHGRLQEILGRDTPITELFRFSSIRALAERYSEQSLTDEKEVHRKIHERALKQRAAMSRRKTALKYREINE